MTRALCALSLTPRGSQLEITSVQSQRLGEVPADGRLKPGRQHLHGSGLGGHSVRINGDNYFLWLPIGLHFA